MKLLAVDAGNTRIKWALHDGTDWTMQGSVAHSEREALAGAWTRIPAPERILVANVAGPGTETFLKQRLARWHTHQSWIESRAEQCGVRNGYADPAQLGCDRWAALIAARRLVSGPCLVVGVGTAVTVDALGADGLFHGGLILPGPGLMKQALSGNTARLADEPGSFEPFPTGTRNAIESGIWQALAGAVERMAGLLRTLAGAEPACIVSGGAASLLLSHLNIPGRLADNLVLDGLLVIARESE